MEQCKNATELTYKAAINRILLLLNTVLWLLVFYLSIYKDEIAASLSCISVALTIFVFREMESICEALTFYLNIISKMFITVGISLVVFSEFWNTALYSTCLGILIQKMIYDMKLQALNVNQCVESDASDELIKVSPRKIFQNVTQYENTKEPNRSKYVESVIQDVLKDMLLQSTTEDENIEEILPLEIQSTYKESDKPHSDASGILTNEEEYSLQDFDRYCLEQFDKSGTHKYNRNDKICHDSSVAPNESLPNPCESLFQLKMSSNCVDIDEAKGSSLCDLDLKILNAQELVLNEFSKIKAKFDLDVADIEREIEENEVTDMNFSEQYATSSDMQEIAFPESNVKQLVILRNGVEYLNKIDNITEKELLNTTSNSPLNGYSDYPLDFIQPNDQIPFCSYKNLRCQNGNKMEQKQLKTIGFWKTLDCVKHSTEPDNKFRNEPLQVQTNKSSALPDYISHVNQNIDFISSSSCNPSRENRNEIKHETNKKAVQNLKYNTESSLLNEKSIHFNNICSQRNNGKIDSSQSLTVNRSHKDAGTLRKGNIFGKNEESDTEIKYSNLKCTSIKTADIEHGKEMFSRQTKCSPDNFNDDNLKISEKDVKLFAESANCLHDETYVSNECKQLAPRKLLQFQKLAHDVCIQEKEMKKSNRNKYYESAVMNLLNDMLLKSTREDENIEEIFPLEIPNTHKELNKAYTDVPGVPNDRDELFNVQDFQRYFHEQFDKNGILSENKNDKILNDNSIDRNESLPKCSKIILRSEMLTNNVDFGEAKKIASLCTPTVRILNIQELEQSDLLKIQAEFDLDVADIECELQENKVLEVAADMDASVKLSSCSQLEHGSSKINELLKDVEARKATEESFDKAFEDESEPCTRVSNVGDAVNRIDLSFIYALGFNVPL